MKSYIEFQFYYENPSLLLWLATADLEFTSKY